MQSGVLGAKLL